MKKQTFCSLFDAHGIHSAVNHDAIMNANDEEKAMFEEHALKGAQRAAEALRQSQMLRSRESILVPTWTGKSGAAGAPSSTINSQLVNTSKAAEEVSNGISAAELLARLKEIKKRLILTD
ncbi:Protein CHROMATIN REMODELING 8 [Orobanche hederae]